MRSHESFTSKPVLIISHGITFLAFFHLVAGAVIAGDLTYAWNFDWSGWWYENSSAITIRGALIAFWCVTPAVLFLAHAALLFNLRKRGVPSAGTIIVCTVVGVAAWATQLGLEGTCIWGPARFDDPKGSTDFCPWVWGSGGGLHGVKDWASGFLFAWVVPWLILPFFPL